MHGLMLINGSYMYPYFKEIPSKLLSMYFWGRDCCCFSCIFDFCKKISERVKTILSRMFYLLLRSIFTLMAFALSTAKVNMRYQISFFLLQAFNLKCRIECIVILLHTGVAHSMYNIYCMQDLLNECLCISLCLFCLFPLSHQILDSPYFTLQLASCPFSVMIFSALCPIL